MLRKLLLGCLLHLVVLVAWASAHYLWVTIDPKPGEHGNANVYFEESPAAGDGHYLPPFLESGRTWIRTVADPQPRRLDMREVTREPKQRWLQASLPQSSPRSVESYGKFGVYRYGKTDVLLHYYARRLDVRTHEALHELARAEHMQLDVVPHDHGETLELTVLWKGKPAARRPVYIRGPKRFRTNLTTDAEGKVRLPIKNPGRYLFRTNIELDQAGREGDQTYELIRHHATLAMDLPLDG